MCATKKICEDVSFDVRWNKTSEIVYSPVDVGFMYVVVESLLRSFVC